MLVLRATVTTRERVRIVAEEHIETLLEERISEQGITVTNVKVELLPPSASHVKNCGETMTENKKGVRELERELANARAEQHAHHAREATQSRDFSVGGIDPTTTVEKKSPDTADVPDAILLPKRKRPKTPNNPWG